jgi:hypothetical protein
MKRSAIDRGSFDNCCFNRKPSGEGSEDSEGEEGEEAEREEDRIALSEEDTKARSKLEKDEADGKLLSVDVMGADRKRRSNRPKRRSKTALKNRPERREKSQFKGR